MKRGPNIIVTAPAGKIQSRQMSPSGRNSIDIKLGDSTAVNKSRRLEDSDYEQNQVKQRTSDAVRGKIELFRPQQEQDDEFFGNGKAGPGLPSNRNLMLSDRKDPQKEVADSEEEDLKHYQRDADNGLSYQKLKAVINSRHPRRIDPETNQPVKLPICGTKTGSLACLKYDRQSDLKQYGPGIVIYFQTLKYLTWVFVVMTILSLPSMAFYVSGNMTAKKSIDIKSLITAISLGNIGASNSACSYGGYNLNNASNNTTFASNLNATVYLSCAYGTLSALTNFGQVSVASVVDCVSWQQNQGAYSFPFYPNNCQMKQFTLIEMQQFQQLFDQNCKGMLPSNKCNLVQATLRNWQYVVTATCDDQNLDLFNHKISISKQYVASIVVILDLVICFFFWLSLLALVPLQRTVMEELEAQLINASDFTIVLKQEPYKDNYEELRPIYWAWAENILEQSQERCTDPTVDDNSTDKFQDQIINVNFGLSNYGHLNYYTQMGKLLIKKKILTKKLMKIRQEQDEIKNKYDVPGKNPQYQELESQKQELKQELTKIQEQSKALLGKVETFKKENSNNVIYTYLQFHSMNGKNKFKNSLKFSSLSCSARCMVNCGCQKNVKEIEHKLIGGHYPIIEDAPDPTLIRWENLGVGKVNRFCRSFFSILFCILIIVAGFLIVILIQREQDKFEKTSWSPTECGTNNNVSQDQAKLDFFLPQSAQQGTWQCFCYQQFQQITVGIKDIKLDSTKNQFQCKTWLEQYTLSLSIVEGIAIFLAVLNFILKEALAFTAKFEKKHTVTNQLQSMATKMCTVTFLNTAIVLVLINFRYMRIPLPPNSFILRGNYADFSPDWYGPIGATITFTCIINAFLPITNLMYIFQAFCVRCCDRKCTNDMKKTRQMLQSEYEKKYIGPDFSIETRYSVIIAMTFIILMYSLAMPILYPCGIILCFISYWTDKTLFLRLYRNPPHHGLDLAKGSQKFMELAILLHLFVGLYMISNPQIFNFDDSEQIKVNVFRRYGKIVSLWYVKLFGTQIGQDRFNQMHTIIYLIGITIFLVCFIFERVFGLFSRFMDGICCCLRASRLERQKAMFSTNFLKELSAHDLLHEYEMTEIRTDEHKANLHRAMSTEQQTRVQVVSQDPKTKEEEKIESRDCSHLHRYFLQRLYLKKKFIELQLINGMREMNIPLRGLDTRENFSDYLKARLNKKNHRMQSLYSYNIFDNPDFIQLLKIEKRIKKFKIRKAKSNANKNSQLSLAQRQSTQKPEQDEQDDQEIEDEDYVEEIEKMP